MFFKKRTRTEKIIKEYSPEKAGIKIGQMLSMEMDQKPGTLSKKEISIALINIVDQEVHSGGFFSFYWNSYGDLTEETIHALAAVGSKVAIDIVTRSKNAFPDAKVPSNINDRQTYISENEDVVDEIWEKLDQEFYTAKENLPLLSLDYIQNNLKSFR